MSDYDPFKDTEECPACGEWLGASERAFGLESDYKRLAVERDVLSDRVMVLEAERDLFRSAVNDLVPRIERLERTAAALEGGDDE